MNMLDIQPRVGFAYAISDKDDDSRRNRTENYMADQSTNGSDGFSSSASYTNSLNNGLTPYTATTGQGLSNPIPVVPQPSGSRPSAIRRTWASHFRSSIPTTTYLLFGLGADLRNGRHEARHVLGQLCGQPGSKHPRE